MIDPHDLWLVLYDNIGFRRCGSKPGWDQFIALQLVRIPKEVLKNWGLYPDPLIPQQELLSWDNGNQWEEIRGNVDYNGGLCNNYSFIYYLLIRILLYFFQKDEVNSPSG